MGPQVGHRGQLQLGVADAAGKHGAAQRKSALLRHRAGGREVVAEAVVDQVARAHAGGVQAARHAPAVRVVALRLVQRAGRLEHAPRLARVAQAAPAAGGEAGEGIDTALRRLRLWPLLDGYRGRARADTGAVVAAVMALQSLLEASDDIEEIEINPLMVRAQGAVAVDAVIWEEAE